MKVMNEEKLSQMAEFIRTYIATHNGASPRFGEILSEMGMSNSVGYRYLTTLRDRGIIEYNGRDTLSVKGQDSMKMSFCRIAVVGSIPCGLPEEHSELIEQYVALPEEWVNGSCYLLRASGDSMIGAGIDDGDLVLIRRTETAHPGQIVVALVDGTDSTLKRFLTDPAAGEVILHAENPKYRDIRRYHVDIQGVAIKVIKDL